VQELPQLRGSVITQLDFLGREFGSCAFGEWICGTQDVIEQPEGRFNLEAATEDRGGLSQGRRGFSFAP
jgi:hypothetical protein